MPKVSEPSVLKVPDVAVAAVPVAEVEKTWTPVNVTVNKAELLLFARVISGSAAEMS